jgi:hypothetical protein
MDHREDFSKWMQIIMGELPQAPTEDNCECDCQQWNCDLCFPGDLNSRVEEENIFIQEPETNDNVKLGNFTKNTTDQQDDGHNSSLTYGHDILDEESEFDNEKAEVINDIMSLQQLGLSKANEMYNAEMLNMLSDEDLQKCYDLVTGESTDDLNEEEIIQYVIYDRKTQEIVRGRGPYNSRDQARKAADRLDNKYGAYRYGYKPLENKSVNEALKFTISLLEQVEWDNEINETFLSESSLSKLIGKQKGGQNLVKWLHRRHKLSNDAELSPAPFSQRLLWKEFKKNPDNFIIISAENGVAGVKPYKKFIDDRTKEFAKKGKIYNPGGDSTLPYQVIAFTDNGQQIDPDLLRAPPDEDGSQVRDPKDPTIMNARMGKHSGKDNLNPYNVFNLLADQIGSLRTVYISGFENEKEGKSKGSVERDKLAKRIEYKSDKQLSNEDALGNIVKKMAPVLSTLINQSLVFINKKAKQFIEDGDFDSAQKISSKGQKIKQILSTLDTNSISGELLSFLESSISSVVNIDPKSQEYNDFLNSVAKGNTTALRPILDALRRKLIDL